MEQKNIEMTLKSDHTVKVLQFYNQENEKSRKIIELSNDLLQESYCILNGNLLLTEMMRDKFTELYKIHDQRGVKFTESNEIFEISENHNQADYLFDADHLMAGDELIAINSNKRQRDTIEDVNGVPTKKRVVRSIFDAQNPNVTQVIESHTIDDNSMNSTFAIKPAGNKMTSNKVYASTSRALKENNPNVHKGYAVPRAITKTVKPITKGKLTLENKRTPLKTIRRSPRSLIADPLNRSK